MSSSPNTTQFQRPSSRRRHVRRPAVVAGTVLLAVTLAACSSTTTSSGSTASAAPAKGKTQIALVTINETDAFFTQSIKGAEAEAKKLGVDLVVNNPDNSTSQQNTAIQTYANQNFNAVIVDSINGDSVDSAVQYAKSKGTHVVAIDAIVNSPAVSTQISVDNKGAGEQLGRYFVTWAKSHLPGGVGRIGVIGALNSPVQVQRQQGFTSVVEAGGSKILQVVDGENVQSTAQTASQNLVTSQPTMNVVYDTGGPANTGALSAIQQAGKNGKLPLFGWDLDPIGITAIKDGVMIAAIQQNPYEEGVKGVEAAVALSKGQSAPKIVHAPVTLVTKSNVDSVKPY